MASRTDFTALLRELAVVARDQISRATPDRAFGRMKKSYRFLVSGTKVTIFSIYYWTRFVNDGRKAIQGKMMIFYRDPEDDPRIQTDYPKTRASKRKLTKEEVERDSELIVVTRNVGPTRGLHFIERGIRATRLLVPPMVRDRIRADVRRNIRRGRNKISIVL